MADLRKDLMEVLGDADLADRAAAALTKRYHVVPKQPEGNHPYRGVLDRAVAAARISCWKRMSHGIHYQECCVRAALEVALTPDPARDLWEVERDDLRARLADAIGRWHAAEQKAFRLQQEKTSGDG
ncbi:hypothetical protein [Nonomuraea angiospora]|uniref:hypothetical protein n=1 Tax=Nonomuraea angiospora TaxID=46172 RepID=UPI0029BC89C0|nr:hypothetical protein [Nonomuraea angiospora]MDX3111548.1 hypothetical protein [Nonomuraea angiospora]